MKVYLRIDKDIFSRGYSPSELAYLMAIAARMNRQKEAHPSIQTVANDINLSPRTVTEIKKKLILKNAISVTEMYSEKGERIADRVKIIDKAISVYIHVTDIESDDDSAIERHAKSAGGVVQNLQGGGAKSAGEVIDNKNNKKEKKEKVNLNQVSLAQVSLEDIDWLYAYSLERMDELKIPFSVRYVDLNISNLKRAIELFVSQEVSSDAIRGSDEKFFQKFRAKLIAWVLARVKKDYESVPRTKKKIAQNENNAESEIKVVSYSNNVPVFGIGIDVSKIKNRPFIANEMYYPKRKNLSPVPAPNNKCPKPFFTMSQNWDIDKMEDILFSNQI